MDTITQDQALVVVGLVNGPTKFFIWKIYGNLESKPHNKRSAFLNKLSQNIFPATVIVVYVLRIVEHLLEELKIEDRNDIVKKFP